MMGGTAMGKYIPPEKMTVEQIQANIDERFRAWNQIVWHRGY